METTGSPRCSPRKLAWPTALNTPSSANRSMNPCTSMTLPSAAWYARRTRFSALVIMVILETAFCLDNYRPGDARPRCPRLRFFRSDFRAGTASAPLDLPKGIHFGLRVIEEISREHRCPNVGKRVGHLRIAPAGFLGCLPGGVSHVA